MLPTFIWFALPAPDDILRRGSVTGAVDAVGSAFQALTVAALCLLKSERSPEKKSYAAPAFCVLAYYAGWALYYLGYTGAPVIACLTLPPCAALLCYADGVRNYIAVISGVIFTICHLVYATVNFIAR